MATKPTYAAHITLIDFEGEQSTVTAYLPVVDLEVDVTGTILDLVGTLADLIAATTNAKVKSYGFTVEHISDLTLPAYDSGENSNNIEDKLFLELIAKSNGQKYALSIPAPKDVDFGTDGETVSWAEDSVVDLLLVELETNWVSVDAGTEMKRIKGYKRRSKTRRALRSGIPTEQGG